MGHLINVLGIRRILQFLNGHLLGINTFTLGDEGIKSAAFFLGKGFAEIGSGISGITVEDTFKERVGLVPFAVLQSQLTPFQHGADGAGTGIPGRSSHDPLLNNTLLYYNCILLLLGQNLTDAPQQVLGGTDLAQILGLQAGEFLGHILARSILSQINVNIADSKGVHNRSRNIGKPSQGGTCCNTTDKEVTVMLSESEKQAEILIAEGEAEYMRILSEAYADASRQDFYSFVRSLDALKASLTGNNKTVILSPESPIAQIFYAN